MVTKLLREFWHDFSRQIPEKKEYNSFSIEEQRGETMNYQVGNNGQNMGYDKGLFGNAGIMGNHQAGREGNGSILNDNRIGDLLACRLVKAGKEPVLDMNGIQIKTRASKELENANEGDTVYLKIQGADRNQVSLKIVGVQSAQENAALNMAVGGAQVAKSTEQFSDMIKENLDGALDEEEAKENQKEILRTLSPDEIAKLRMMQIDVTNSTLSDLMGMVINIRSGEHQDEVNELLGDVVKETLGKLQNELMPEYQASQEKESVSFSGLPDTESFPVGGSRLNSEGYVVKVPAGSTADVNESFHVHDTAADYRQSMVTDEQLIYMIKNNMDLTIDHLYTARNSVNEESPLKEVPLDHQVWNDIYPQVSGIIEAAGMTVSEQSLMGAQFMLCHELPITVDSLRIYMAVHSLNQRGIQPDQTEANIREQIALGNPPEQARINGSTLREKAERLIEKTGKITMQAVDSAVSQRKSLTISYLYNSSMRNTGVQKMGMSVNTSKEGASLSLNGTMQNGGGPDGTKGAVSANSPAVSVRRQLEEIRLAMTLEASLRLVKQDINIDARPLSQIVEALRKQEKDYYENVVSAKDLHDIPEGVDLLKETLKETDSLKDLPAYALGEMVKRPAVTVGGLYETAIRIKNVLAGNAYETMMTRPRRDMGDSITEAFQNVDAILEDMNMDRNEENQRAIRILAYNEMELNETNIMSVKAADAKVQQMFETLTPQIVLNLIRENKNPLNMTVDGLNEEIMQQKEVLGITDEQRFSEFLYQMDKTNAISDKERQSFIGIYRLLDKVEKSHGKDIGAVVRNGQEITLNNLFAANKSRKAEGIDVAVDDNFGERIDVETNESSILSQIETAYNQTLTGSILRHIRPETLKSLEGLDYQNMTFEELDSIIKAGDSSQGEAQLIEELGRTMEEALSYEEEVEMMLEANDMPKTATNIIAAHQVMYGQDGIYGMIHTIKGNLPKDKKEQITRKENNILETLESKGDIIYGMENIRSALSEAVHDKEADGTITAMDIQALKYLNAGMPIAMRAVEEEVFQIPLVVGEEISIMKVSVLQDGSRAGEITASMDTSKYGRLEAFIHVEGNQIEGYVVTEEESGQKELEANELTLRSVFAKAGMEMKDLRLDGTKPIQYGSGFVKEEVPTSKLYKVAKQLLTAIKLMGIAADNESRGDEHEIKS